jgi:hypothetical protein
MHESRSTDFSQPAEPELDRSLQDGLQRVAIPPVSTAFDERVLASLALPEKHVGWDASEWIATLRETAQAWWNGATLQLVLSGAACAVIVTLGGYALTLHSPLPNSGVTPGNGGVTAASPPDFPDLDTLPTEAGSYQGLLLGRPRLRPKQTRPPAQPDRRRGSENRRGEEPAFTT